MSADFDAPTTRARRMFRQRTLVGMLFTAAFLILTIIFTQLGLLDRKFFQVLYSILVASLFIGLGIWIGLRKNTVLCPRCGWNIFFKKPMPMLAICIPSHCPNCGLDLERPLNSSDERRNRVDTS
jgi:hypothetical protein